MKETNEILFRAICLLFSALLLVLSLLCSIRLAAVNDSAARLEREKTRREEENAVLRAAYESSVSLEAIEEYAVDTLGMQRCMPGQIVWIETPVD